MFSSIFRVWTVRVEGFIVKSSELMDPPTIVTSSRDNILPADLDLDPSYMEELHLASQEVNENALTIQGELSKFKGFGVKYLDWYQRSKFGKSESNHTIVKKFFIDHESEFPKINKVDFQIENIVFISPGTNRPFIN